MDLSKCNAQSCPYYTPKTDFETIFRRYVEQVVKDVIKERTAQNDF